ncbi:UNKNOWN [Stylonychia lemnae]|uniref:Uncharacterized protein n=1 Tax=Stylonychia lemnae TaxID=5949 RepID=A0A077ZZW7_STYLE|nr:UNKNOWN [Stylonychia lemnae]|eukprot:CDW74748.1 UNKNOWN [Stylonychia lemnae]
MLSTQKKMKPTNQMKQNQSLACFVKREPKSQYICVRNRVQCSNAQHAKLTSKLRDFIVFSSKSRSKLDLELTKQQQCFGGLFGSNT